jgi:hypothetical protein
VKSQNTHNSVVLPSVLRINIAGTVTAGALYIIISSWSTECSTITSTLLVTSDTPLKAYLDKLMTVEIPISYVIILQKEPNILGKTTDMKIITSQSTDTGIQLEFDFGKGRVHYNYSYEISNSAY